MSLEDCVSKMIEESLSRRPVEHNVIIDLKPVVEVLEKIEVNLGKLVAAAAHPVLNISAPTPSVTVGNPAGEVPIETTQATGNPAAPAKRGPGRPRKNPLPSDSGTNSPPAQPALTVVKDPPADEPAPLPTEEETLNAKTYTPPVPCKGCGVDTNIQGVLHSKACDVVKGGGEAPAAAPEKKEEPKAAAPAAEQPPFEKVRELGVQFAQKHSKEKLKEVSLKFQPAGDTEPKLSRVVDRAAFIAELEKGLVA